MSVTPIYGHTVHFDCNCCILLNDVCTVKAALSGKVGWQLFEEQGVH